MSNLGDDSTITYVRPTKSMMLDMDELIDQHLEQRLKRLDHKQMERSRSSA